MMSVVSAPSPVAISLMFFFIIIYFIMLVIILINSFPDPTAAPVKIINDAVDIIAAYSTYLSDKSYSELNELLKVKQKLKQNISLLSIIYCTVG